MYSTTISFDDLLQAKSHGFNLTVLLVQAYLRQQGPTPVGVIASACELSARSVERAIAALKAKGLLSYEKTTEMSHDHVTHGSLRERTATVPADKPVDPLAQRLLDHEVLPWCVDMLLAKVDRAVLEKQLDYHAHRLATGFSFKGHPARYLFRACLNDYQPPQDFHAVRNRVPEERRPVRAAAQPVEVPRAEMTREGALTTIRLGLRSRLPHMRAEAERLAAHWQINLANLAV
jgi:hypothetical protein